MNILSRASHDYWSRKSICPTQIFLLAVLVATPGAGSAQTETGENMGGRLRDSAVIKPENEWNPDFSVPQPRQPEVIEAPAPVTAFAQALAALEAGRLEDNEGPGAISLLQAIPEDDPEHADAANKLAELADSLSADIATALGSRNEQAAATGLAQLERVSPEDQRLAVHSEGLAEIQHLNALWLQADALMEAGSFVEPESENALAVVREIMALDGEDPKGLVALETIETALVDRAQAAMEANELLEAKDLLAFATEIRGGSDSLVGLTATVDEKINTLHRTEVSAANAALEADELDQAELHLANLENWGYEQVSLGTLRLSLERAKVSRKFPAGRIFSDQTTQGDGPVMVVVPQGQFTMGSPDTEPDRSDAEGPQREIAFDMQFALSKTEVTVAQFAQFVASTEYVTDAERKKETMYYNVRSGQLQKSSKFNWRHDYSGRKADPELPVVHVSWNDAKAYARWLSEESGTEYRLPSEAEFEYALRSGSDKRFWWGEDEPNSRVDNLTGSLDSYKGKWEWPTSFTEYDDGHWGPAPSGSFDANAFGLQDMGGNVMEWTEDCWADTLVAQSAQGDPVATNECEARTVKGGSWASPPTRARSAYRVSSDAQRSSCLVGFRVARVLEPRPSPRLAKF